MKIKKEDNKNNKGGIKVGKDKNTKQIKKRYKVSNWSEYNQALKNRGRMDFWIEKDVLKKWYSNNRIKKRGAQKVYSDLSISLTLQLGKVFNQKLRQNQGLVESLFKLMKIDLDVPDYSTLSRRGEKVEVILPKDSTKDNLTFIVDSTGLKVHGEGEWKVRKHGYSKHRTWKKIHLAVTPGGEIRAVKLTGNDIIDSHAIKDLFSQEKANIDSFVGDGAYDKKVVYDNCKEKGVRKISVPPQKNAKIWQHGNCNSPPHPRDENLREIRKTTRKRWKENCGYHVRSLSETAMFRLKTILGDKLNARKDGTQITEAKISAAILNRMMTLGMPKCYPVE